MLSLSMRYETNNSKGENEMKVKVQRINRYSKSTCSELETIKYITVDIENGTAEMNGKHYRYTAPTKARFGRLGSKKVCYYILEILKD